MTKDVELTWLPQKTFELKFSLPWTQVKTTFELVMKQLVKDSDLKGFRKGKAPRELIEKQVDKGKVYGEVINQLLPLSYAQAVKKHNLKPALSPKITIVSAEEGKAWQFKAKSCELPEVKLGNYQGTAKSSLVKSQLEKKELTPTQKFDLIARALIQETKLELPEMLIESERDRLLSKLLAELQKLGLTIEQYANSNQKTVDQVKNEYQQTASNTLKLELILQAVAADKKIIVKEAEIDKMISEAGGLKIERAYIAAVLKKKQAIDFLTSLG